jgi:hypothetical protein
MRYADFLVRVTGLCVAVAGAALAGRELLVVSTGGIRLVGATTPGSFPPSATATVIGGVMFVLAGLAVLGGVGRSVAVSVGGAAAVGVLALLAIGPESPGVVVGVGAVALALLFAGAATGGRVTA